MREHEGAKFIPYQYNIKYSNKVIKTAENKHPKKQGNGSEGHFSVLYVIIEVYLPNN